MTQAIDAALREAIIERARAGADPECLVQLLTDRGWDPERAVEAADGILREFIAEHARQNDLPAPVPVPSPIELNGASVIHAGDRDVQVLTQLLHPRIVVFGSLLSKTECDGLIALGRARLARSSVVNEDTGGDRIHEARTSEGTHLTRGASPLCSRIEARIAALLGWPVQNGEGLQILRYSLGAQYKPHYDYFDPQRPGLQQILKRGGQRVASLVMYLNTPTCGGATTFPDARLEVAAIKGNAVFFSYDRPHPMTRTLHGGAPVLAGEKWVATKWLREGRHD